LEEPDHEDDNEDRYENAAEARISELLVRVVPAASAEEEDDEQDDEDQVHGGAFTGVRIAGSWMSY
jgi:hypothetical protein